MTAPSDVRRGAGRGRWVLALLLLSGVVALTALPVWVSATGSNALGEEFAVTVRGTAAAPGVVAAALVLLAAAAALGLVGRVGRWVVGAVVAAAGVLVTASALAARSAATVTAERAAADVTGVPRVADPVTVAVWPLVTAALGVLVVLQAVALVRASRAWAAPSDRHERVDRTTGPTSGRPVGGTSAAGAGTAGAADDLPVDERGAWDALTRGDDPT
ncbi:Trp biosynthesis-associated membrane protein [Cellulomonas sp. NPDC058312]|uniref:Trp biosynthesis-associated membrane protein n=1 Tax=Cellulomonas sp. NPDC058312 TaxID=3346441 RepID=UPI0036ECA60A